MAEILALEDEPEQLQLLGSLLAPTSHRLHGATSVAEALEWLVEHSPDIALLDLHLPDGSGLDVLRELRKHHDAYVIIVSARIEETDRIVGLAAGADDYVCKPYSLRELEMRIEAMLRRPRRGSMPGPQPLPVNIDPLRRLADVDGTSLELTRREFDLLDALASHRDQVLSRRQLLERIWGGEWFDDRVVISHMSNLRRKLAAHGLADLIVTVRGVGYRLAAPDEPAGVS